MKKTSPENQIQCRRKKDEDREEKGGKRKDEDQRRDKRLNADVRFRFA